MKKPKPSTIKQSELTAAHNEIVDQITETAAREVVAWMKAGGVDVQLPIHSINLAQMKAIVTIAHSKFVVEASKKRAEFAATSEGAEQLELWLG